MRRKYANETQHILRSSDGAADRTDEDQGSSMMCNILSISHHYGTECNVACQYLQYILNCTERWPNINMTIHLLKTAITCPWRLTPRCHTGSSVSTASQHCESALRVSTERVSQNPDQKRSFYKGFSPSKCIKHRYLQCFIIILNDNSLPMGTRSLNKTSILPPF